LAFTGATPAPAASQAVEPRSDFGATLTTQINDYRVAHGAAPLVTSAALTLLAQQHAQDMLARGFFDHTDPTGVTFDQRIGGVLLKEGYKQWISRENLGFDEGRGDPAAVIDEWDHSVVHHDNLLAKDTPFIGVGAASADAAPGVFDGLGPVTVVVALQGPPQPVLGESVLASVVSGKVLVRAPGSTQFVPLRGPQLLRTGTEVDTTRGRVHVTSVADEAGTLQASDFYEGRFVVTYVNQPLSSPQPPPAPQTEWITQARLSGALPVCTTKKRTLQAVDAKPKPKRKTKAKAQTTERHLWGNGQGTFRTKGAYAAATVRGTIWLVRDDCTGTFVRVVQGVVEVNDVALNRIVRVGPGQTYTARRPRR